MDLVINFKTTLSVIVLTLIMNVFSFGQQPIYLDSKQPIEKRVDDLLSRMTLKEKIGQLNMPCVYESPLGKDTSPWSSFGENIP
jgi:beta-glucosidase